MKKMKLLLLIAALMLSLSACRGERNEAQTSPTPSVAPTGSNASGDQGNGANEDVGGGSGTDNENGGNTGNGTDDTGGAGTDDNGGTADAPSTDDGLNQAYSAVKEYFGDDYIPSMAYDALSLQELFGLSPEWYDAVIAEGPMISVHIDKFVGVHATEGNVEQVAAALNAYRDSIISDLSQYPSNLVKIQGSVVETIGDYVFFSMLGMIDDMEFQEESDQIAEYQRLNQEAIAAARQVLE